MTSSLTLSAVPREDEGKASGANNTIRELGGVFGVAVLAAIFAANGSYAAPRLYVDGLIPAVAGGAAVVALAAVVAASPSVVEQILFNLVDNACKYAASATDRRIHIEILSWPLSSSCSSSSSRSSSSCSSRLRDASSSSILPCP